MKRQIFYNADVFLFNNIHQIIINEISGFIDEGNNWYSIELNKSKSKILYLKKNNYGLRPNEALDKFEKFIDHRNDPEYIEKCKVRWEKFTKSVDLNRSSKKSIELLRKKKYDIVKFLIDEKRSKLNEQTK